MTYKHCAQNTKDHKHLPYTPGPLSLLENSQTCYKLAQKYYFFTRQYKEALQECDKALAADTGEDGGKLRSIILDLRSLCNLKLGNHDGALGDCFSVLEINPKHPNVNARLGRIVMDVLGDPKEAIIYFDREIEIAPTDKAHALRAVAHHRLGNSAESSKDYEKALELCGINRDAVLLITTEIYAQKATD